MTEDFTEMQRMMPGHPVIGAVLWHIPSADNEQFSAERWFTAADYAECEKFSNQQRREEWAAVRIALKHTMIVDGVAESALHIHVRKDEKGAPYAVIYNPQTGYYARYACSLSHKGSLVFAAYAKVSGVRIGIDMERRSWKLPYLRRRFVSPNDVMLEKDDSVGDCTVLWTFKEAATKLLGLGMGYGFTNVYCRETSAGLCEITDKDERAYLGSYIWYGKYALAVVMDPPPPEHAELKSAPSHERSWLERIGRARRLRKINRERRVLAQINSVKGNLIGDSGQV